MTYKRIIFIGIAIMLITAFCEIMGWTQLYNTFGWTAIIFMIILTPFAALIIGSGWYYGIKSLIDDYKERKKK